jgi:catechol 2,3-dioxygenase-like lactoylglutathione lyase family enzyme
MTKAVPRLGTVVLDCPDPLALSNFYARLLEWSPDEAPREHWTSINGPDGGRIDFQRADEYHPSTWPDPERPQMFHFDFWVDDLDAGHERALALGAKFLEQQQTFRVYADPAGHPFCLCQS